MKVINRERAQAPLLLAEQLIAWRLFREGEPVHAIGYAIRRPILQARAILYGR